MASQYYASLCKAMERLGQERDTVFVGQGVKYAGTTLTDSLVGVPKSKLLEFPVAENLQVGFCIGQALEGKLPICIVPRWNFLICATDQIVNSLDRLSTYSRGQYNPRVIIRVATPIVAPFYPGPQHDDDFTNAFRDMLRHVKVVTLQTSDSITREYQKAAVAPHSTILVEYTALYGKDAVPSAVNDAARKVMVPA